jgi:hypothetical protein
VWHKDIAKMYALVEQMLKQDNPNCRKPWDMPNRMYETPLFLAIQKRCVDAVWYMLEVGANPNAVTRRPERDGPLHYAAARGMTEIVEALCAHTSTNVDLMNGMGMTALLCAVRNHGVIEEDSQCLINNKPVIRVLLKSGAQANIAVRALSVCARTISVFPGRYQRQDCVALYRRTNGPRFGGCECAQCSALINA